MLYPKLTFEELYNTQNSFSLLHKDYNVLAEAHLFGGIHWHDYLELEIIIDGTCVNAQNGTEYNLKRGDIILCRPLDFHKVIPSKDLKLINISFKNDFLDKTLSYILSSNYNMIPNTLNENALSKILNLCSVISDYQTDNQSNKNLLAKHAISAILMIMIDNCNINILQTPKKFKTIMNYIDNNFTSNITLTAIADKFSMSPSYLGKLFKANMNISYNSYVNKKRINYACHLLTQTSMSYDEISKESGFSNSSYFFLTFKKILGVTPSEYRSSF